MTPIEIRLALRAIIAVVDAAKSESTIPTVPRTPRKGPTSSNTVREMLNRLPSRTGLELVSERRTA